MDVVIGFLVFAFVGLLFLLPVILLVNHGRRLRTMQTTLNKLTTRVAALEGRPHGMAPEQASEAVARPTPVPPPPIPSATPTPVTPSAEMSAILETAAPRPRAAEAEFTKATPPPLPTE